LNAPTRRTDTLTRPNVLAALAQMPDAKPEEVAAFILGPGSKVSRRHVERVEKLWPTAPAAKEVGP
jgi:hypothetical protein